MAIVLCVSLRCWECFAGTEEKRSRGEGVEICPCYARIIIIIRSSMIEKERLAFGYRTLGSWLGEMRLHLHPAGYPGDHIADHRIYQQQED